MTNDPYAFLGLTLDLETECRRYGIRVPARTPEGKWIVPSYFIRMKMEGVELSRMYVGQAILGTRLTVPPKDGTFFETEYVEVDEVIHPPFVRFVPAPAPTVAQVSSWSAFWAKLRAKLSPEVVQTPAPLPEGVEVERRTSRQVTEA